MSQIGESFGFDMQTQTIIFQVISRTYGKGRGWIFTPDDFRDLGNAKTVQKALEVLGHRGQIRRLARGLYDYPKKHPKLGDLFPTPDQIAVALARRDTARVQPAGAYAANLLGLTEQVPAQAVFLTEARDRRVAVGRQTVVLKRTTPKNMATAGRISGLVIQGLRYLGAEHVDQRTVTVLGRRLSDEDRRQLLKDARYAPGWISKIMRYLADPPGR
jgi:hypothetical protein